MSLNTSTTIIKATGLSGVIFWAIIFTDYFNSEMFLFVLLSVIPVSICCSLTICLTIAPFYWLKQKHKSYKHIYKTYLPYYAIILFGLCIYLIVFSNFELFFIAFVTAAFFTTLKSWSWLIEPERNN